MLDSTLEKYLPSIRVGPTYEKRGLLLPFSAGKLVLLPLNK